MRNLIYIFLFMLPLFSCGGNTNSKQTENAITTIDQSVVYVYYFHGKQRCKTCLAIEKVTKQTINDNYKENTDVQFVEVNIDDKKSKSLTKKYEIAFSSLLIAKGENYINITEEAFKNAVNNPDALTSLIKQEVNKRIEK